MMEKFVWKIFGLYLARTLIPPTIVGGGAQISSDELATPPSHIATHQEGFFVHGCTDGQPGHPVTTACILLR